MIRVFEAFAGYGGASFALKRLNIEHEIVGYSEINPTAIKCYNNNFPNIKNYGDIRKINPHEIPDFDLFTAGFPCQPFSINTRKTVRGKNHKDLNLFVEIIKIIQVKKPKYILLENVKGLTGKKMQGYYQHMLLSLEMTGYDVKCKVLNSKNFGIPQNRERVFFVGKLGKWGEGEFNFPVKEELKLSVKDILENNIERRKPAIMSHKLKKQINIEKFGNISRFDAIYKSPVIKNKSNVIYEILDAPSNQVSRQSDRIYSPIYSPCLTATGKDYLFEIDGKVINLTGKECFRLMGFLKDEINLDGINENQRYKLAGNGWDINLVSKIFKQMLT